MVFHGDCFRDNTQERLKQGKAGSGRRQRPGLKWSNGNDLKKKKAFMVKLQLSKNRFFFFFWTQITTCSWS